MVSTFNVVVVTNVISHDPAWQTIGAEFQVKQVTIPDTNVVVELFIYDCAGQSIFNQLDLNTKYVRRRSVVAKSLANFDVLCCMFSMRTHLRLWSCAALVVVSPCYHATSGYQV